MTDDRTIIFKVDLDIKSMEKAGKQAEEELKKLNSERIKMLEGLKGEELANKKNTVEFIKLNEQIKNQQKILKDNATAIQINNELRGKSNLTTAEQSRLQKSLANAYNNLTDEQKENTEEGKAITKAYAELNKNLIQTGLNVNDGRRNVGRYKESIIEAEKEINELKNTIQKIGYVYGQNAKQLDENETKMQSMMMAGQQATIGFVQLEKETAELNETMKIQQNILDGANEELKEQEEQLDATKKEAQKIGFVYGENTKTISDLRRELKETQDVMARTDASSEEYQRASVRAGELRDKLKEVKENTNQLAGGSGFEKMSNSLQGLKNDLLNLDFEGVSEKAKTLQNLSQNMTFKEATDGIKNLGSSLLSLGKAILTNPLFLLVGTLTAIGVAIWEFIDDTEELEKAHEKLNKTFEREIELLERANDDYLRTGKERLEIMEIQGATEEELHRQRIENIFSQEIARQDELAKYKKHLANQKKLYADFIAEDKWIDDEVALEKARKVKKEIKNTKDKIHELLEREKDFKHNLTIEEETFEKYKKEKREKEIQDEKAIREKKIEDYKNFINRLKELQLTNTELSIKNERNRINVEFDLLKKAGADVVALEYARAEELRALDEKEKDLKIDRLKDNYRKEQKEAKGNQKILNELEKKHKAELEGVNLEYKNRQIEKEKSLAEIQKEIDNQIIEQKKQDNQKIEEGKKNLLKKLIELNDQVAEHDKEKDTEEVQREKDKEQQILEIKQKAVEFATNLVNAYNEIVQRQINQELESATDLYDEKIEKLDKQLKQGLISQESYDKQREKAEKEYRKKEKELKTEAFEKNKTASMITAGINTAVAVTHALKNDFPLNVILAGLVAGLGAVQIGLIASQPTPKFAKGGKFKGKSHSEGGVRGSFDDGTQIEVEKDEMFFILNKKATPLIEQLSDINVATGGIPLMANGGTIEVSNRVQSERDTAVMMSNIVRNIPTPIVLVEDINTAQTNVVKVESEALI